MSFKEIYHQDMYRAGWEIRKLLQGIQADASEDDLEALNNAANSGIVYYNDPFTISSQPLALSLPLAHELLSAILLENPAMRGELVAVYAESWYNFYQRLTLASTEHPVFAETVARVQQRFNFADVLLDTALQDNFSPEKHTLTTADISPIEHWKPRYDVVCTAASLTLYPISLQPEAP